MWVFVIFGLIASASVLHGLATSFQGRRASWLLHGAALLFIIIAWWAGHLTLLGWAALFFGCLVELLLRLTRPAAQPVVTADRDDAAVPAPPAEASPPAAEAKPDQPCAAAEITIENPPGEEAPITPPAPPTPSAPPAPPLATWALLRQPWEVAGDVFLASLRRGGVREAELIGKSAGQPVVIRVGPIELHVASESRRAPQAQLDYAAAQSWDWPDAASAISAHAAYAALTTRTTLDTPRLDVIRLHCQAQAALAEFAPVVAIVWPDAGRLLPVSALSEAARNGQEAPSPTASCINFRLFPPTEQPSQEVRAADQTSAQAPPSSPPAAQFVSDSVGLHAFGLPDVQICTDGEPSEKVSAVLYQLADRIFKEGWTGDDDAAMDLGDLGQWRAARGAGRFPPERDVVNLTPLPLES